MKERLLAVGLDEPECEELRSRIEGPVICYDLLPRIQLDAGRLSVEKPNSFEAFVPVSRVVFHGIFEDDLPFLTALALWGGPCLPDARGMMDCRLRLPCLVRALEVTRFGKLARGFADRGSTVVRDVETVAKWGEWHCGENKAKFAGSWRSEVPTLFEHFVAGQAVRIHVMGDRAWQIRLAGDNWLKSIHHAAAGFMDIDPELLEDTRRLQQHFRLEMMAVDYMLGADGGKYLLEVNHIPNVTVFPEIRQAFFGFVSNWVAGAVPASP